MIEPIFVREELEAGGYGDLEFQAYRKIATTQAARVQGPFGVETREGLLFCPDGWLAIDSGGWPYPIAVDEFERIYTAEPAG